MQEAALDPDYESLSWSDSDDYDQYAVSYTHLTLPTTPYV